MPPRVYLYKLTSDRGGAPCAPLPAPGQPPLLTLAICKPAIRRTAQPGDRIIGITSHALHRREGYPLLSVIYAAIVQSGVQARDYFAPRTPFTHRPDCIYRFHRLNGTVSHTGRTALHADAKHILRDLGRYPFYRNGRVLTSTEFRYFGSSAPSIPPGLHLLTAAATTLAQGHRVFTPASPEFQEAGVLFRRLFRLPTRHTPAVVTGDAYDCNCG